MNVVEPDEIVSVTTGEAEGVVTVGVVAGETAGVGLVGESNQFTMPAVVEEVFSRLAFGFPKLGSYLRMTSTSLSRALSVY